MAAALAASAVIVWGLLRLPGGQGLEASRPAAGAGMGMPSRPTPTPARFQVACLEQASGLRDTPDGPELRPLPAGLPVWVLSPTRWMVHVRLPEGEEGYLPPAALHPSPETDLPVACVRSTLRLRLREGPGTRFPIRELLNPGTPLGVLEGPRGGWLKVRTPSGRVGWVAGEWVSPIALRPTGETIPLPAGP